MSRRVQLLFFVVGLALLALLVHHVGAHTLLADLRRAGWTFPPIVLLWAVVYAMNTAAWLLLVHGDADAERRRVPFGRAYVICVSSFALNYATPFVALGGEALRVSASTPWLGGHRAAASTIAFRVVHTAGQFVFWLLSIPVAFVLLPHTAATRGLLAVTAVVLVAGTVLLGALLRARTLERLLGVLPRVPLLRRLAPALERRRPSLLAVDAELAALARERPRRLAAALAIETTGRFLAALEFVLIARGVGEHVSWAGAAVIGGFSQLVMNVLFFVPFEMGPKEGSLFAVFRLLGYGPRVGVYGAVVSRLREVAWIAIGLTLIWLGAGRSSVGERRDQGA
jgi:hypothetical protein